MRVMVIRKADPFTEAGGEASAALLDAMNRYHEALVAAGVMRSGDGLKPSAYGARVRFRDGVPSVTDGPFAEAKELVAGFSVWEVGSMAEALAWARRWPTLDGDGNVELELRPLYEMEELAGGDELARLEGWRAGMARREG